MAPAGLSCVVLGQLLRASRLVLGLVQPWGGLGLGAVLQGQIWPQGCVVPVPLVLCKCTDLHPNGQRVLSHEDAGDPGVPEEDHIAASDEDGGDVDSEHAQHGVQHHLVWHDANPLHADLTEGHTRENQEQDVAVEEHDALSPERQPLLLGLPQVGLDVQHIQHVHNDPEEAVAEIFFLLECPDILHVLCGHQQHIEGWDADGEQQGQCFAGYEIQVFLVSFIVLVYKVDFDLQNEDIQEPEDHGVASFSCLYLCPNPDGHVAEHQQEAHVTHCHHDTNAQLPGALTLLHQVDIHEDEAGHDERSGEAHMELADRWWGNHSAQRNRQGHQEVAGILSPRPPFGSLLPLSPQKLWTTERGEPMNPPCS